MKNTLKTIAMKGALLAGMVLSLAGCNEKGPFTDARDGKTYKTVRIGSQTWMAENLNYETDESYCFGNDPANCEEYGRLYTWAAAMDSATVFGEGGKGCGYGVECIPVYPVRGVCPEGWHLPSDAEWNALEKFVADSLFGGNTDSVGYALKSRGGWEEYKGKPGNGSDAFGFGALPAGGRYGDGTFDGVLEYAFFWSSTENGADSAYSRLLYCRFGTGLFTGRSYKVVAISVRCVKDS